MTTGRLDGRVALITGAASGIGAASARRFAREGATVILVDRLPQQANSLAEEITASGGSASVAIVDLMDASSVAAIVGGALEGVERLDVLFNCAGGSSAADAPIDEVPLDEWDRTLSLDLGSVLHVTRASFPALRASPDASVINMSSVAAFRGTMRAHAYAAAKGAVAALTRSMAGTYATEGIRVNAIAPGAVLSDRTRVRLQDANIASGLTFDWADYPFARGVPDDIASVALFLASAESRMLTGQTIMADGGLTAY